MEQYIENETPNQSNETLKIALSENLHHFATTSSPPSKLTTPEEIIRINENDQFVKSSLDQIHRIQYSSSQMLLWNFNEISLKRLKNFKTSVKRYLSKLDKIVERVNKFSTLERENCAITNEEIDKADLPTVELWYRVCDEIWKRRHNLLRQTISRGFKKKLAPMYRGFAQKWDQLFKRLRCHQLFVKICTKNNSKLFNLAESTINSIWEKISRIVSNKNLCKIFRETKEIINNAVSEASKLHHLHFSLVNKLFKKYLKLRKFIPIFKVKKSKQAYHKKSISKITALIKNENEFENEKKWTSKIYANNLLTKTIVASSSMKYNWKYRKKFALLMKNRS